ncbi:MAG: hypothetical protein DRQ37_04770 [Gammaproteobacteria bacterium]|nr:MAG: hypothetical protein DRQ37_04770 [Gammaproteobacteria bacterium]
MNQPDYANGSIVNLVSGIAAALGAQRKGYAPFDGLDLNALSRSRVVVLMVIDGLGYDYLCRHLSGGTLHQHLRGRLTSVFPATTASAVTSFFTGVAPQQHAVTGWFTWLKELGTVAVPLPFRPRVGGADFTMAGIAAVDVFHQPSIFSELDAQTHVVLPARLAGSAYTRFHAGTAERHGCTSLDDFIQLVSGIVHGADERSYVYAYWPELDAIAHSEGIESRSAREHAQELDVAFAELLERCRGQEVSFIVTADHGLVDTRPQDWIHLDAHPALADGLALPLCGEPREAYCYLREGKRRAFEEYVASHLGHCCDAIPGAELISDGLFGLGEADERLKDRVGDYVLIMKDNFAIADRLVGEEPPSYVGVHGGMSDAELFVPLITATV